MNELLDKSDKPNELVLRELKDRDRVSFLGYTEKYGRAEFSFCPIWKRGKIIELYIYPKQQPEAKEFFHVESGYSDALAIDSWTHRGIENPWHWRHVWCKEHKCMSIQTYVPPESTIFTISIMSTLGVHFDF